MAKPDTLYVVDLDDSYKTIKSIVESDVKDSKLQINNKYFSAELLLLKEEEILTNPTPDAVIISISPETAISDIDSNLSRFSTSQHKMVLFFDKNNQINTKQVLDTTLSHEAEMINLADTDENESPTDLLNQSLDAVQWRSAVMKTKNSKSQPREHKEVEDFEQLFSQFAKFKSQADALPREERAEFAEKVVMDMFNALGFSDSDHE